MFKLFRRKPTASNLVDHLKKHPGEMWVNAQFLAVYVPVLDKALIVYGDFANCSDEELNAILVANLKEIKILT